MRGIAGEGLRKERQREKILREGEERGDREKILVEKGRQREKILREGEGEETEKILGEEGRQREK